MFICIEGIDGAGKTTLSRKVVASLIKRGCGALVLQRDCLPIADRRVARRLTSLSKLIWNCESAANPAHFGDNHWLHLLASWYLGVSFAMESEGGFDGKIIVADGWIYKYMARFFLKECYEPAYITGVFAKVREPDLVFLLDVPATLAVTRRTGFRA
jgi:thymidylate kinase